MITEEGFGDGYALESGAGNGSGCSDIVYEEKINHTSMFREWFNALTQKDPEAALIIALRVIAIDNPRIIVDVSANVGHTKFKPTKLPEYFIADDSTKRYHWSALAGPTSEERTLCMLHVLTNANHLAAYLNNERVHREEFSFNP